MGSNTLVEMFDDPGGLRTTGLRAGGDLIPQHYDVAGIARVDGHRQQRSGEGATGDRAGQLAVIRLIRRHPGISTTRLADTLPHVACGGGALEEMTRALPGPIQVRIVPAEKLVEEAHPSDGIALPTIPADGNSAKRSYDVASQAIPSPSRSSLLE